MDQVRIKEVLEKVFEVAKEFRDVRRGLNTLEQNELVAMLPDGFKTISYYLRYCLAEIERWEVECGELSGCDYQEYLNSDRWGQIRKVVMKAEDSCCVLCGEEAKHVHHRTYERRGRELRTDLTALCAECHAKFHNKEV